MSFAVAALLRVTLNTNSFLPSHNPSVSSAAQTQSLEPSNPCHKWRLVIAYEGTHYAGWQYQASPPTVQCVIERALTKITNLDRKDLNLVGAGRTDAGVHAWGQVHAALNGLLPSDIRVREVSPAVPEFHARFSAKGKIYRYSIYNGTIMDPFQHHLAYHSVYRLNAGVMEEAANYFIGKHDFSAFANSIRNDGVRDPMKTISRFVVNEMGPLLQLEVEGSGFLYRQVRNMVALLLQIGRQAVPPDIVPKILESRDRKELAKYALSVPPHGLCLVGVKYKEEHMQLPFGCPEVSFGRRHCISKLYSKWYLLKYS